MKVLSTQSGDSMLVCDAPAFKSIFRKVTFIQHVKQI